MDGRTLSLKQCLIYASFLAVAVLSKKSGDSSMRKTAKSMQDVMNESVNPCDDFYEFACGNWKTKTKIPKEAAVYNNFVKLSDNVFKEIRDMLEDYKPTSVPVFNVAKKLYDRCVDVHRVNTLKSSLFMKNIKRFGLSPKKLWRKRYSNLTALLVRTQQSRRAMPFFTFEVLPKIENKTEAQLVVGGQPTQILGLSNLLFYVDPKFSDHLKAYKTLMKSILALMAKDTGSSRWMGSKAIEKTAQSIIDFETKLAKIFTSFQSWDSKERVDSMKLSELQKIIGKKINISKYLYGVMPADTQNFLKSDQNITVLGKFYFRKLNKILSETDPITLTNYVLWLYTLQWRYQMDKRYDQLFYEYQKAMKANYKEKPRRMMCSTLISHYTLLSSAAGAMYVRKYFRKPDHEAALQMVKDVRRAFTSILAGNKWMDKKTKKFALEKAKTMAHVVGYTDFYFNDTAINQHYAELAVNDDDEFATMIDKLHQWATHFSFRELKRPIDVEILHVLPTHVNAFYSQHDNKFGIPAAILQPPFFGRSRPKALNYGGIGMVVGHEITHGFDVMGSHFDKKGQITNWWDMNTLKTFHRRAACMIKQYAKFGVKDSEGKWHGVDGNATLSENMADNGGFKAAYQAYQYFLNKDGDKKVKCLHGLKKYNNNQIFMISYAQTWCEKMEPELSVNMLKTKKPHLPNKFRVNGVLQNQRAFAAQFNCRLGTPMNPHKKCSVW